MTYWSAVSDRLVTLFQAAVPAGVVVFDGARGNINGGRDIICVGWDDDDDAGSVAFERGDVGNHSLTETGTVTCLLVCQSGTDLRTTRQRAFSLLQLLADAIAADQTLGVLPAASTCSVAADVRAQRGERGVAQILNLQVTYTTPF